VKAIAERAVYFEDVSGARLREFKELIEHLNKSWHALEMLRKHKDKFKSNRLIKLLTLDHSKDENSEPHHEEDEETASGLLPSVREHLAQFDQYIKWEDNVPKPQKGLV
jgi:uncharacterized membrane-anchored protein YhcB (DUF1043 family)